NCAWHYAHRPERVQRTPLEVLAGDVLQSLPTGPEVHAVAHFCVAGNRPHFGIEECGTSSETASGAITVSASIPTNNSSSSATCRSPKLSASAFPRFVLVRMTT